MRRDSSNWRRAPSAPEVRKHGRYWWRYGDDGVMLLVELVAERGNVYSSDHGDGVSIHGWGGRWRKADGPPFLVPSPPDEAAACGKEPK